jgi:hypothetical protein
MHQGRVGAHPSSLLHGLSSTPLGQRLLMRVINCRCCTSAESCMISMTCHSDELQHCRRPRQTAGAGLIFARPELSPVVVGHLFGACAGRTTPQPPASCTLTCSRTLPRFVRCRSLPGSRPLRVTAGGFRPPATQHCSIRAPAVGAPDSPVRRHDVPHVLDMPYSA